MGVLALRVLNTFATPQEKSQILTFTPQPWATPLIALWRATTQQIPQHYPPHICQQSRKGKLKKIVVKWNVKKNPRGKIEIF
jgi:hypothetical protein